jgi:SAM-dependent methyltransferase
MENYKLKVQESAQFYNESFISFDYKLTEMNYLSLRCFFRGRKALELGPALGQMTKYIVSDFDKLDLIDGSKDLLDQIPNYTNVNKYHAYFEEFITEKKYDTIIMSHVLEHIENPVKLLNYIMQWLENDGVLIVSVPNAKSLHRQVAVEMGLLENEFQLNDRDHKLGHYRVYDLVNLKKDAIEAGYRILNEGGIFLKPVSNVQIEENWNDEMIKGFYEIGKQYANLCAEIYVVLTK